MLIRTLPIAFLASVLAACCAATAQQSPSIQLTPYTAPDQSASAGVPAGWKVSSGNQTVITLTGPQGETVFLGNTYVAQNAAFQAGQRQPNGIDLAMPYSATVPQKLSMIIQQAQAFAGKPLPQITINSTSPVQLPPALGQCGRVVASMTNQQGPTKIMAVLCSLPLDAGGAYKNIVVMASAPAAVAVQSAPTAQAIFQSYKIPPAWMQKKLAPHNAPQPTAASLAQGASDLQKAAAINRSTALSIQGADTSANCFSLALRETPNYLLPKSCGGTKPD